MRSHLSDGGVSGYLRSNLRQPESFRGRRVLLGSLDTAVWHFASQGKFCGDRGTPLVRVLPRDAFGSVRPWNSNIALKAKSFFEVFPRALEFPIQKRRGFGCHN